MSGVVVVTGASAGVGRATAGRVGAEGYEVPLVEGRQGGRDDLRRRTGPFLDRRRRVAALSLLGSAAMGLVAAYQNGLLRHLPEPALTVFDADRVDASGEVYELLKTPDAALGLVSYALTLVLAGAGTASRAEKRPWLPLALAAKVAADALGELYLTVEQASKHHRFCMWCLTATMASVAMVPQVVPEARAALRRMIEA